MSACVGLIYVSIPRGHIGLLYISIQDTLQHTATHCNALQRTATHCNALQHTATQTHVGLIYISIQDTLQHTATHCNKLQHTATQRHVSLICITTQMDIYISIREDENFGKRNIEREILIKSSSVGLI